MTSITLPDAILAQIKTSDRAVEVCDSSGQVIGYFAPLAQSEDYRSLNAPLDTQELDRRSRLADGRILGAILSDLKSRDVE